MAILPIGTDLQLVLYDASVYSFSSTTRVVNIFDRPVVSRLNALQVLSSIHNVYFGGDTNGEYVRDLIDAHRVSFRDDFNVVRIMPPGSFLVDGVPSEHEILHTFEQQLPISLDLPFLNCPPAPPIHQIPTCRNENLAKTLQPTDNVVGGGSLSADQFLQETLPRIQLPIT